MNVLATQYTLMHKSFEIYLAGCMGENGVHCFGCHNSESWNFNQGEEYTAEYFSKIKQKINDFDNLIDNIFIMGGEPLDQKHDDLLQLLMDLKPLNKEIWLFTRYDIEEVPITIQALCNYIKCGKYIKELATDNNIMYGIKLATSNQKIYKIIIKNN